MKTRIIGAILALLLAAGGAFLLVQYVRSADARAAQGATLTEVFIVEKPIPVGTPGEVVADFVTVKTVQTRSVVPGNVTRLSSLKGLVAGAELLPGEQLIKGRFVDPAERAAAGEVPVPEGMQQVTLALPVQRVVGGAVVPGSTVGIVVTWLDVAADPAAVPSAIGTTRFQFDKVLVTAVAAGTAFSAIPKGVEVKDDGVVTADEVMVTLAMSTHDIERLVWAAEGYDKQSEYLAFAGIWMTLQNEATDTSGSSPVTEDTFSK